MVDILKCHVGTIDRNVMFKSQDTSCKNGRVYVKDFVLHGYFQKDKTYYVAISDELYSTPNPQGKYDFRLKLKWLS